MKAKISDCGKYRYTLHRTIYPDAMYEKRCLFIMLNPSTADDKADDPTIRRCMGFAKRHGCTEMTVVNLFALRSTDPKELLKAEDAIGPENDLYINEQIDLHQGNHLIIAAWGSNSFAKVRAKELLIYTGKVLCLGKTKNGHPRHPLYVRAEKALEPIESLDIV